MHLAAFKLANAALVIREYTFNSEPEGDLWVRIVGRKEGIIAWFFTLLGIDNTTVFEVYTDHVRLRTSTLSGTADTVIPLTATSELTTGYFKPILYLYLAFFMLFLILPTFGISLIFAILFGVLFFLRKTLVLLVSPHSGSPLGIAIKRSVIEGKKIDQEEAEKILQTIRFLIVEQTKK